MSAINDTGHGSAHEWRYDVTDIFGGEKGTRYFCGCGQCFVHLYDVTPDIFGAMQLQGVPVSCPASVVSHD